MRITQSFTSVTVIRLYMILVEPKQRALTQPKVRRGGLVAGSFKKMNQHGTIISMCC